MKFNCLQMKPIGSAHENLVELENIALIGH